MLLILIIISLLVPRLSSLSQFSPSTFPIPSCPLASSLSLSWDFLFPTHDARATVADDGVVLAAVGIIAPTRSAVRRYAVRRRNGNSGKGRPRSKADQRKADDLAAARAAAVAAGVATEVDFAAPPKRVFKKDIPTVKRRVGRPRKVLVPPVEEERGISSEERAPVSTPVSCSLRPSSDVVNNRTGVTVGETRVAEAAAAEARGDERQRRHRSSQRGYARAGSTGLEGQGSRRFEDDGGSDPEAGGRGGGGAVAGGASPRASDEGHAPPEVERNLATEGSAGRPPR